MSERPPGHVIVGVVVGSRLAEKGGRRRGGMPVNRDVADRLLTGVENRVLGTRFSELHRGFRAFSRETLIGVPFLRNSFGFSFDSEILFQAAHFGFRIPEIAVPTHYAADASSITIGPATVYALKTLWMATRLVLHRRGILRSRKFSA